MTIRKRLVIKKKLLKTNDNKSIHMNERNNLIIRLKLFISNKDSISYLRPSSVKDLAKQAMECSNLDKLEKPGKNKGERGQKLEKLLGLENNNNLTDVSDGDLKSTTIGQTIALTQLSHCLEEIIESSCKFEQSKLGKKITNCLYIIFKKNKDHVGNFLITKDTHPKHYKKLVEDFDYISKEIRTIYKSKEKLKTINGPNKLLQIRTKASKNSKGEYTPLVYKNHQLKDKHMAFYLRATFSKNLMNNCVY